MNIHAYYVTQGDLKPDTATNSLWIFEGKFTRLTEDRDNVAKAKEALELQELGEPLLLLTLFYSLQLVLVSFSRMREMNCCPRGGNRIMLKVFFHMVVFIIDMMIALNNY